MANKLRRGSDLPKTAVEALRRGALIEAIKAVRQERNIAFKEAKAEVEAYLFSQPALKKKMDKVLVTAQQKFVRWMIGFLVFAAGVVLLILLGR
jgi:hypothetical protein